jgi:hypothetical protein
MNTINATLAVKLSEPVACVYNPGGLVTVQAYQHHVRVTVRLEGNPRRTMYDVPITGQTAYIAKRQCTIKAAHLMKHVVMIKLKGIDVDDPCPRCQHLPPRSPTRAKC